MQNSDFSFTNSQILCAAKPHKMDSIKYYLVSKTIKNGKYENFIERFTQI